MTEVGHHIESVSTGSAEVTVVVSEETPPRRSRNEIVYFALRNTKLVIGLTVVLAFLGLAIVGPWLTDATPFEFGYPTGQPPSSEQRRHPPVPEPTPMQGRQAVRAVRSPSDSR